MSGVRWPIASARRPRRPRIALSEAQRVYDEHVGRSERAAAVADPRAVRVAKEAAWAGFRAIERRGSLA